MRKAIVVTIVAIFLLLASFAIQTDESNEIESSFGFWKVDIITETDNGNKTLSIADSFGQNLLSVFSEDQEVTSIDYVISARATGEGYTHAELDMSNAYIVAIVDGNEIYGENGNSGIDLQLDSGYKEVFTLDGNSLVNELDSSLDTGEYTIKFKLNGGNYRFRGVPSGDWQTSTSFPTANLDIEVATDSVTCFRCDGQGGVESDTFEDNCPSGWSSNPPDCDCYTDTIYGDWSSWSNVGCSGDCYMKQKRTRDILEATICPGFVGPPYYEKVGTDTQYRDAYSSSCCEPDEITCYKCDGQGGVESDTFEDNCPSGWSSNPPDCDCYTDTTYGSWSSWEYHHCVGAYKWDKRTRDILEATICPGFVGPPYYEKVGTDTEWRYIYDPFYCNIMGSIVSSTMFSVTGSDVEPYRTSNTQYLGGK